jgi:hypothetical protein
VRLNQGAERHSDGEPGTRLWILDRNCVRDSQPVVRISAPWLDAQAQTMKRWIDIIAAIFLLCAGTAYAHLGSPDVYAEGQAGPYHLAIVIRPPLVIPGVAEIDVRAQTPGIDRVTITPVPLTGEAAEHPPVPDTMQRPSTDRQFFTGHLWIMAPGSWQVRFAVSGPQGPGALSIPLPATAMATRKMQPALGAILSLLGILLVAGMVGIVGAASREAKLDPGLAVPAANRRRGYVAMSVTLVLLVIAVLLGSRWWKAEAASYRGNIYKPLQMTAFMDRGNLLDLKLYDPGWLAQRQLDDFIPDHDHLMHLYMIRWPQMDVVYHLHPGPVTTGEFQLVLPSMPAGDYRLYADVVHSDGFPETLVAEANLPAISGRRLAGDDAEGIAKPVEASSAGPDSFPASPAREQRFNLPDDYTMVWRMPAALAPKMPEDFRFELLDPDGKAPRDMALYMGMLGHAAFVKTDGTVFAHIHPSGTVAMAAYMMANPHASMAPSMDTMNMPGMEMSGNSIPNTVSFPYGFPTAGRYRIFVQMKHGSTVETGVFDATVPAANP